MLKFFYDHLKTNWELRQDFYFYILTLWLQLPSFFFFLRALCCGNRYAFCSYWQQVTFYSLNSNSSMDWIWQTEGAFTSWFSSIMLFLFLFFWERKSENNFFRTYSAYNKTMHYLVSGYLPSFTVFSLQFSTHAKSDSELEKARPRRIRLFWYP